jgi:hypothetical protein
MTPPVNDLERAFSTLRGAEHYPNLFRLLRESELVFLIPYHPEMEGMMGLGSGDPLPPFVVWKSPGGGERIPLFTSIERAEMACKNTGASDTQYNLCEMKGTELFHLLSCQETSIVINPATDLKPFLMDTRAAKKLYDGSILKPMEDDVEKFHGKMRIVEPADYPTDLLQPLFQFLRGCKAVRAAWLFRHTQPPDPNRPSYVFALKVSGDFKAVQQGFAIVLLNLSEIEKMDFGTMPVDETNPKLVEVTLKYPAFYAAPDYQAPSPI